MSFLSAQTSLLSNQVPYAELTPRSLPSLKVRPSFSVTINEGSEHYVTAGNSAGSKRGGSEQEVVRLRRAAGIFQENTASLLCRRVCLGVSEMQFMTSDRNDDESQDLSRTLLLFLHARRVERKHALHFIAYK